MIHLVCGPPGAGKNTYVESKKQKDDMIIDLDMIRAQYTDERVANTVRAGLESSAKQHDGDSWVIRTLADSKARTDVAKRLGAKEVVVIATPAELAKQRAQERDPSNDLSEPIDRWWSEYTPLETDLVVTPDLGNLSDREKKMGETENNGSSDKGFPDNTPIADMTAEQQAAYWRHHSRKHENAYKELGNVDELKEAARQWKEHQEKNKAPDEKALEAAREEGRKEALKESSPRLVGSEFKSQAAGKVPGKILDSFLEDINFSKYVKDDGAVDTDAVKKRVEALTPEDDGKQSRNTQQRDTHQSRRQTTNSGSSMDAGRELHERVHGKKN